MNNHFKNSTRVPDSSPDEFFGNDDFVKIAAWNKRKEDAMNRQREIMPERYSDRFPSLDGFPSFPPKKETSEFILNKLSENWSDKEKAKQIVKSGDFTSFDLKQLPPSSFNPADCIESFKDSVYFCSVPSAVETKTPVIVPVTFNNKNYRECIESFRDAAIDEGFVSPELCITSASGDFVCATPNNGYQALKTDSKIAELQNCSQW
jgi:hypothetical protein